MLDVVMLALLVVGFFAAVACCITPASGRCVTPPWRCCVMPPLACRVAAAQAYT